MTNLHPHRQHALAEPDHVKDARRLGYSMIATVTGVITLVALLAIAQQWDAQAKAEDAVIDQRIRDRLAALDRDRKWTQRMADAYAQGRSDAIEVRLGSPEARRLALACATFASEPR